MEVVKPGVCEGGREGWEGGLPSHMEVCRSVKSGFSGRRERSGLLTLLFVIKQVQ